MERIVSIVVVLSGSPALYPLVFVYSPFPSPPPLLLPLSPPPPSLSPLPPPYPPSPPPPLSLITNQPFAERSKLEKDSTEKLPESIWKFGVYVITWVWSAYILHERDIMFDLSSHWDSEWVFWSNQLHVYTCTCTWKYLSFLV